MTAMSHLYIYTWSSIRCFFGWAKTTPKLQNFLALDQKKEQTRKKRSNWYSTYMHSICICLFAVLQSTSQAAGTGQKRKRGLEDAATEDESVSTAPGGASSISTLARTGVNLSSWGPPGPPSSSAPSEAPTRKQARASLKPKSQKWTPCIICQKSPSDIEERGFAFGWI